LLAAQGMGPEFTRYENNRIEFPAVEGFAPTWVIKTDEDGRMLITYFGKPSHVDDPNSTFLAYSYVDVLNGKIPPEAFAGKIVLIGALDSVGQPDFFPTPISRDERMYGVEIHASVIETIIQLNRRPDAKIRRPQLENLPQNKQLLYIVEIAFLAGIIMPFLRWHTAILTMLLGGLGYLYWAFLEFYTRGQIIDLFYPWLAIGLSLIGTLVINYTFEERRRNEINELFSRYVSPEIARKVVESYDKGQLKLGGEERQITVLFADIRGFTTLSEGLSPTEVLTLLNSFLEQMNTIVLKYHGTINKYIGDNLMAFWNAPYTQQDHAWLATQAAFELLKVVQDVNKTGEFRAPVLFGIGINTGNAVIGNIGSQERLEYTPIGDTVNIASRLSGVAEGGACLMGETTYEAIKDRTNIEPTSQQEVMLKGKRVAIKVYEIKV
jgi:adenylate cyclase